jgi:outer membrane protein OmpA-like peptidoglycan-associated protein
MTRNTLALAAAAALLASAPATMHAQRFGDRLKRAASEAVKRTTEAHVEPDTEPATDATPDTKGAFVSFDFVPGTRVLFADDFARDDVGDFPRHLEFKDGNAEVATLGGARWLRTAQTATFAIPLPETLPSRFTFEAELQGFNRQALEVWFEPLDGNFRPHAMFNSWDAGLTDQEELKALTHNPLDPEGREGGAATVRLMADGQHVKAYVNGIRVANVPQVTLSRTRKLWLVLAAGDERPVLLGNVRVMAGGKALYDALATDGRVATQGIYFDTGRDALRAESKPTLDEIAAMLKEHGALRVRIEGHTDDVGDAAANQALSEKRAAAVRQALVSRYGIAASRLEAQGFGAAKPVAPNATSEGRQQNRRVELVKL